MEPLLKVTNLKKSFGGVHALKDISLELERGEILGLIGPNGSGKSTFVNTIAGLYRPDGGNVMLEGVDVTAQAPPAMARHGVARTFQSSRPFLNLSVLENVTIAALLHTSRTAEAEAVALAMHRDDRTEGLHAHEEREPAGGKEKAFGSVPGAGLEA